MSVLVLRTKAGTGFRSMQIMTIRQNHKYQNGNFTAPFRFRLSSPKGVWGRWRARNPGMLGVGRGRGHFVLKAQHA